MRLVMDVHVQTGDESETVESAVVMFVEEDPVQMFVVIESDLPG